jgi:hypothetical protein
MSFGHYILNLSFYKSPISQFKIESFFQSIRSEQTVYDYFRGATIPDHRYFK